LKVDIIKATLVHNPQNIASLARGPDNDYIRRGYTFAFLTRSLPTTKPNQQVYDPPSCNIAQLFISDAANSV